VRPIFFIFAAVVVAACSAGPGPQCRVGADCASGACRADGTCVPLMPVDDDAGQPGSDAGTGGGDAAVPDAGEPVPPDAGAPDAGPGPTCQQNNDGTITRGEMPMAAGLHATFRIARDVSFSSAGAMQPDGRTLWDFGVALSGDSSERVDLQPISGQWFESDFPGATYSAPLPGDSDLLGVFEATGDALLLRGLVSKTDGFYRTRLTYSPPARLLSFPLSAQSSWTTSSTVTGLLNGGLWTYSERYEATVDRAGEIATPFSRFPGLRVKLVLTQTVGFAVTVTRQFLFVTECFGTVATLVSQPNEFQSEFSSAAEVRRLAP
jgi:hypothetical protein